MNKLSITLLFIIIMAFNCQSLLNVFMSNKKKFESFILKNKLMNKSVKLKQTNLFSQKIPVTNYVFPQQENIDLARQQFQGISLMDCDLLTAPSAVDAVFTDHDWEFDWQGNPKRVNGTQVVQTNSLNNKEDLYNTCQFIRTVGVGCGVVLNETYYVEKADYSNAGKPNENSDAKTNTNSICKRLYYRILRSGILS